MEAVYVTLSQAAREGSWLKKLLTDLRMSDSLTVNLEDSQGSITKATNPVNHSRTKTLPSSMCAERENANAVLSNSWREGRYLDQATDNTKVCASLERDRILPCLSPFKLASTDYFWKCSIWTNVKKQNHVSRVVFTCSLTQLFYLILLSHPFSLTCSVTCCVSHAPMLSLL